MSSKKESFPHQRMLSEAMYGFRVDPEQRLAQQADRAASRIVMGGQGRRDGHVSMGTNNPMADFAAAAFSAENIKALHDSGSPLQEGFARIIELRREFAALKAADETDSYWAHTDKLEEIGKIVNELDEKFGWKPYMP
jgi:hypothetical protein